MQSASRQAWAGKKMPTQFNVAINVNEHASDAEDALLFRQEFEQAIAEYGIGKVIWGGMMTDGSSVDVSFVTEDTNQATLFLEDYLNHCGVFEDSTIDTEPHDGKFDED